MNEELMKKVLRAYAKLVKQLEEDGYDDDVINLDRHKRLIKEAKASATRPT